MSSFKSPVDTAKTVSSIGGTKSSANVLNVILLSFLAGAYIAFGGLLAEVANAGMLAAGCPLGLSKFVFGAVLGGMACFDFGGPVNKTMSTFVWVF